MNRILFEAGEIDGGRVSLPPGDARAAHILEVLKATPGKVLKTGTIGGLVGESVVEVAEAGRGVVLSVRHETESLRPWVDLILAPPRPRAFKRLLPQLVQMGVGTIHLVGAEKVEKMFWGATILKEEEYRPVMVDALMQCGASILPKIEVHRNFRRFAENLPAPAAGELRIVAHPAVPGATSFSRRDAEASETQRLFNEKSLCGSANSASLREKNVAMVAIGPEGGWTDAELELLEERGFARFSLTERILRTDTAAIAILGSLICICDGEAPPLRSGRG